MADQRFPPRTARAQASTSSTAQSMAPASDDQKKTPVDTATVWTRAKRMTASATARIHAFALSRVAGLAIMPLIWLNFAAAVCVQAFGLPDFIGFVLLGVTGAAIVIALVRLRAAMKEV